MRTTICSMAVLLAMACLTLSGIAQEAAPTGKLRLHAIFDSDMVLQRGKPIVIWVWAESNATVTVKLGKDNAETKAAADKGRWEVTFPAREASAEPQTLIVTAGDEKVEMGNIVIGDVWVMYGQSNMAFPLRQVLNRDTESAQANLPNLRLFSIHQRASGPARRHPSRDHRYKGLGRFNSRDGQPVFRHWLRVRQAASAFCGNPDRPDQERSRWCLDGVFGASSQVSGNRFGQGAG